MPFIYENHYEFNIKEYSLETVHSQIERMLSPLPESVYAELLIALHELIINSYKEMEVQDTRADKICIHIYQHQDVVIIQVNDSGRGIKDYRPPKSPSQLNEAGRGLVMVTLLTDWFLTYPDLCNRYSYYIIKKLHVN
jgi:anti-sigma regulatory factor (Ser/Thr protein kinase)